MRDMQVLCKGLHLMHINIVISNSFKDIHHTSRGVLEASAFFSQFSSICIEFIYLFIYLSIHLFTYLFSCFIHLFSLEAHSIQLAIGSFVRRCVRKYDPNTYYMGNTLFVFLLTRYYLLLRCTPNMVTPMYTQLFLTDELWQRHQGNSARCE